MTQLYIATTSHRDDIVKVGKSDDPDARCKQLQASQPFYAQPAATLPFCAPSTSACAAAASATAQGGSGSA